MAFWLAECGQGITRPSHPHTQSHNWPPPCTLSSAACCLPPGFRFCCGHIKVVSAAAFILIWKLFPRPTRVPASMYAFLPAYALPMLILIIFAWLLLDFYYISRPHCVYAALYNCHRFHYNLYMACYITRRGFNARYRWEREGRGVECKQKSVINISTALLGLMAT